MKRFLNRLLVTDPEQTDADAADADSADTDPTGVAHSTDSPDSETSTPVAWTDLSRRTAGPAGSVGRLDQSSTAPTNSTADADSAGQWLLEAVIDERDEPTFIVDDGGEIIHLNSAACEQFGTTEAEARGIEPHQLHGGDRLARQVIETGEPVAERRQQLAGVADDPVSRRVVPLTDDDGRVAAAMETISVDETQ